LLGLDGLGTERQDRHGEKWKGRTW